MRIRFFRWSALLLVAIAGASVLLAYAAGCGGKKEAKELSIDDMWQKAAEADTNISSWHMEIASYYENTKYGGGQIQSIIIDVNGDDLHEQDLLLGQVYFEYMRVGGKQYNKDMASGNWTEVPATSTGDTASEVTSQFLELPSVAESQEHVGTETIGDQEAERFHFTLTPQSVIGMFATQPSFDFSQNSGGEVDVWIDSNGYYMLRYELLIRNVIIPEQIGTGDIRFVVNIRDINEPIEITPPI